MVLRLPSFFATRHLTFDDGVFGASAVAMRNGGVPFRDVFSSQGPLFLPLVWLGDTLGLHTLNGPRLLTVLSGVALVVVLYLAGREVSDRLGALVAGGLAAVTGSCAGGDRFAGRRRAGDGTGRWRGTPGPALPP